MNNRSVKLSISDESETLGIMHEPLTALFPDLRLRLKCYIYNIFHFFYQPVPLTLSVSSK